MAQIYSTDDRKWLLAEPNRLWKDICSALLPLIERPHIHAPCLQKRAGILFIFHNHEVLIGAMQNVI